MTKLSGLPPHEFFWGHHTDNFTETGGDTDEARAEFESLPRAPPRQKTSEEQLIIYPRQDYRNVVWSPPGRHLVVDVNTWELMLVAEHRYAFSVRLIFSRHQREDLLRLSILLLNAERKPHKVEGQSPYVLFEESINEGSLSRQVLKDFCAHFDLDFNLSLVAIHISHRRAESVGLIP